MKFVVIFSIFCVAAASALSEEETMKFLQRIAKECSEEVHFDLGLANKLLLGDFSDRSAQAKCFMKCFFEKEGFLNDKGEAQRDFMVEALSPKFKSLSKEELAAVIDSCSVHEHGEDTCGFAHHLLECFTTNDSIVKASSPSHPMKDL